MGIAQQRIGRAEIPGLPEITHPVAEFRQTFRRIYCEEMINRFDLMLNIVVGSEIVIHALLICGKQVGLRFTQMVEDGGAGQIVERMGGFAELFRK